MSSITVNYNEKEVIEKITKSSFEAILMSLYNHTRISSSMKYGLTTYYVDEKHFATWQHRRGVIFKCQ